MKQYRIPALVLCSLLFVSSLVFLGCEVGSSDSVTRTMEVDFTGLYTADTDVSTDLVSPANSGTRVTSLNLIQSGDQLQAIDNNGIVFGGTLNDVSENSGTAAAGFTLEGSTTAGKSVTISGSLSGSGTTAEMRGTWIEPDMYAYVTGQATINLIPTNGTYTLTMNISPSGGGTTDPTEGEHEIDENESVTLTATAASNYTFSSWSGSVTGSTSTITITMDSDKSVTANFTSN